MTDTASHNNELQGVHIELTVEGLGRAAFHDTLGWIWEHVDFLFPIITGQWDYVDAVFPVGILAGLACLFRLILHLADGGRAAGLPRAFITDPHDSKLATWRPYNQWENKRPARTEALAYSPALDDVPRQPPPAPVRERIDLLDGFSHMAYGLFYRLARLYIYYMALSLALCWLFGLGDLGTFFAPLGIGGGS